MILVFLNLLFNYRFDLPYSDIEYRETIKQAVWRNESELLVVKFIDAHSIQMTMESLEPVIRCQTQVQIYNVNKKEFTAVTNRNCKEWFVGYVISDRGNYATRFYPVIPMIYRKPDEEPLSIYEVENEREMSYMKVPNSIVILHLTDNLVVYRDDSEVHVFDFKRNVDKVINKNDSISYLYEDYTLPYTYSLSGRFNYGILFFDPKEQTPLLYPFCNPGRFVKIIDEPVVTKYRTFTRCSGMVGSRIYYPSSNDYTALASTLYSSDFITKEKKKIPIESGFYSVDYSENFIIPTNFTTKETTVKIYTTEGKELWKKKFKHKPSDEGQIFTKVSPSEEKLAVIDLSGKIQVFAISNLKPKEEPTKIMERLYRRFLTSLAFHPLRFELEDSYKQARSILKSIGFSLN